MWERIKNQIKPGKGIKERKVKKNQDKEGEGETKKEEK